MAKDDVCPYFHSDSGCDVGADYISPHDVETIVGYCNSRFGECMTYRQINEHGHADVNGDILLVEEPLDVSLSPLSRGGFWLFGSSLGLGLLLNSSWVPTVVSIALMVGGLLMIVQGLHDWRGDKSFAATVNCAYGLFGFSLIPLLVLPMAGMSPPPDPWSTTSYLAIWGLFSIAIYLTAMEYDRWLGGMFGLMTAAILTLAVATASGNVALINPAGGLFALSGLVTILPLLRHRQSEVALGTPRQAPTK